MMSRHEKQDESHEDRLIMMKYEMKLISIKLRFTKNLSGGWHLEVAGIDV